MKRTMTVAALGLLLGLLPTASSQAVPNTPIDIYDFYFTPIVQTAPGQNSGVIWNNNSATYSHHPVQDAPLNLFDAGNIPPTSVSSYVSADWAGSFTYHCSLHPSMVGTLRIPMIVYPASGDSATLIELHGGSVSAPAGDKYQIELRKGSHPWVVIKRTSNSIYTTTFPTGNYRIRSRVLKTATGAHSGWSPAETLTIT